MRGGTWHGAHPGLLLPAGRLRCAGWEQGLKLEGAESGLELVLGGGRELLWHVGCAGLGKVWNVQEGQVDLSALLEQSVEVTLKLEFLEGS